MRDITKESIIGKTYRHSREGGNPGEKTGFLVKPGMTKQGECLFNNGLIYKISRSFIYREERWIVNSKTRLLALKE
jgi:hypothetical protein